ncbi:hypothetical protein G4V62_04540 [Bacillaceae bacterium SIJ1]|uniref:YmaF family protein n=1 Tax=Litoribacterium kuwaitense TaxID=1398745 RepID=UPI0013EDA925|nr:YmaF family protein [Litoribacterium kuwaitense]NGP44254.1 hypothetical protein [Litoribacterium kuwaitense]
MRKGVAHTHSFLIKSSTNEGHCHDLKAYLFAVNGSNEDEHIHTFKGVTSFTKGHEHIFNGQTGPPIPLPNGGHVHEVKGVVEKNGTNEDVSVAYDFFKKANHQHSYKGFTGLTIGTWR